MLKFIKKTEICNNYEKPCEVCGKSIIIHLFPGVSKKWAEEHTKTCINCKEL